MAARRAPGRGGLVIVVFSIHADDACFSVGEYLARTSIEESVWVVTICGGVKDGQPESELDWQLGLMDEADKAYTHLGASHRGLDLWDGKWGAPKPSTIQARFDFDFRYWADYEPKITAFLVPMGIHHPDHRLYSPALLNSALAKTKAKVAIYEDLPYRALYPEETAILRDAQIARFGHHMESAANAGFLTRKLEACEMFESQWSPPEGDASRCCSVPERIWWAR